MTKIQNKEKINGICFEMNVCPFCPLGNDYYNATITVEMEPGESYPDYCEIDDEIKALGGRELTIEQLAEAVYDLMARFQPNGLCVTIDAKSNAHFPVTVTKHNPY